MVLEPILIFMHLGVGIAGLLLSRIDLREHRLPNCGTGALALGLGILAVAANDSGRVQSGLLAAALSAGAFALAAALPPHALGWGDVKLQGGLGFYLGFLDPRLVVVQCVLAFFVGGVVALVGILGKSHRGRDHVAFGPALVAGTALAVIAGKYAEII
jgi:leader peptidase (prepilin peptidase)/N-methyltransferase